MLKAVDSPFLVPFDGSYRVDAAPTAPPGDVTKKERRRLLKDKVDELALLQRKLYAQDEWACLSVFQAMDAAGKDGTIRAVFSGVNPAGFQVFSFKQPSKEELDHDFLWRTASRLPERGRIGVFNRSYYEETLVVRVHPEYLGGQRLPGKRNLDRLWTERYESIRDHELHLARNGTVVVKFWLNVSREEQRARFLERIEDERKNWKFSSGDVAERAHWDAYMAAYEDALNATSRPWAPWYAIPADSKSAMRLAVADIMVRTLESLDLSFPELGDREQNELAAMRRKLESEG